MGNIILIATIVASFCYGAEFNLQELKNRTQNDKGETHCLFPTGHGKLFRFVYNGDYNRTIKLPSERVEKLKAFFDDRTKDLISETDRKAAHKVLSEAVAHWEAADARLRNAPNVSVAIQLPTARGDTLEFVLEGSKTVFSIVALDARAKNP